MDETIGNERVILIEMAEYALSRGIDDEPAFHWWVLPTVKRRKAIVAALKT